MAYDLDQIRSDFPILKTKVNGHDLVYFDNGASAQKPQLVIDAITRAYSGEYANVHRGLHHLSNIATEKYEATRAIIARFLSVPENNVVFTTGSTEGINLVAYSWAMNNLRAGDEVILSVAEHHANIVPWHFLRERMGVKLVWADILDDGSLPVENVTRLMNDRTRLIAVSHMSNVTGARVDVAAIAAAARDFGVRVLVDGSQAAVHAPVNVGALGVDFYAVTGHKLYGPTGSGALYISDAAAAEMRPFMGGGDMIETVTRDHLTYASPPAMFEAGTPGIVETIGLGVALEYLMNLGMDNIAAHEARLRDAMAARFRAMNNVRILGTTADKGAIFTFAIDGIHPHDISTIVNEKGIAVRAGKHCAHPLMERYGVTGSTRASLGLYNTEAEIDKFFEALAFAQRLLG